MPTPFTWGDAVEKPTPASAQFEEDRVKMVLTAFGLASLRVELLDAETEATGTRRLTFRGFRERFPTFPVLLEARYVGRVAEKISAADLFRRFEETFVTDRYLEVYSQLEEDAEGRPIGVVLPFDKVRSGVVVHNGGFDTGRSRLVHAVRDDAPHHLTVEPFAGLLKFLVAGSWSPTAAPKVKLQAATKPALAATIAPWMLKRLGTGPAAYILGWLTALLNTPAHGGGEWVRRMKDGDRYVAMTHEEMATASGLSEAALKRGLRTLKDKGLIGTITKDRRMCLVLIPPTDM